MKNSKHSRFLRHCLVHTSILWATLNIALLFTYWLRVNTEGNYLIKPNGEFVSLWDRFVNTNYYQDTVFMVLLFALLAEAGLHYAFAKRRLALLAFSSVLSGVIFMLYVYLAKLQQLPYRAANELLTAFLVMFAYCFLYSILRDFFLRRRLETRLQHAQREAELKELRTQVNPHFFFNTLNNIYGLAIEESATKTSNAVEKLADLMRYTMKTASEKNVTLKDEFEFLQNYIALQKIKLGDDEQIEVKADIPAADYGLTIAPLLLIPFIENAFQYGISRNNKSFVRIDINVSAGILKLQIQNSVHPERRIHGHGTGITNAKRRLEILYPDHTLQIQPEETLYQVFLTLKLHTLK